MIILGIILLALGLIFDLQVLWIIGAVLAVIGAVLFLVGASGRPVGGRTRWY